MKIVAGDVGGTKTLLQLVDCGEGRDREVLDERRFRSGDYRTFDDLLREFLGGRHVDAACFAVAGPVIDNHAEITNLHWDIGADALRQAFSIDKLALINDFYAVALGVPLLGDSDLLSLHPGTRDRMHPIAILGAGTGLGEAFVVFDGDEWSVIASEGGHADFSPQDEEQARLFVHLHEKYGHVSWERVVSGMGLVNIFTFLGGEETDGAGIAKLAESGDERARKTFAIFVDCYGAEAGNMALRVLARGGVFLAGGIAAKNSSRFTDGRFVEAFLRKGRFRDVLEHVPVDLILNEKVGLMGAAEMARRTLESRPGANR